MRQNGILFWMTAFLSPINHKRGTFLGEGDPPSTDAPLEPTLFAEGWPEDWDPENLPTMHPLTGSPMGVAESWDNI